MYQILKILYKYSSFFASILVILLFVCYFSTSVTAQGCIFNKQYAKTYTSNGSADQHFIFQLGDKSIIAGGPVNNKLLLAKTNINGDIVWSKNYSTSKNYNSPFTPAALDIDGNLACVLANYYIAKLDTGGLVLNTVEITKKTGTFTFMDIKVLDKGDKVVLLKDDAQETNGYILARLSADLSTVIWTKYFAASEAYYKNILVNGDKILMSGFIAYKANVLCFNSADGTLINQYSFTVANRNNTIIDIYRFNGGYLVKGYLYVGGSTPPEDNQIIIYLKNDLTPVKAFRFTNIDKHLALTLSVEPDGGFYGAYGWNNNSLMYANKNGEVIWSRANTAIPVSTPVRILKNADGLITASRGSTITNGNANWFFALAKSDTNGAFINCPYNDISVSTVPLSFNKENINITAKDTSIITISNAVAVSENITLRESTLCASTINCSALKIPGNQKVCTSNQVTFTGRRNANCTLPMQWEIVGDTVQKKVLNDSTIGIQFFKSGTYKLIAKLGESCSTVTDSIEVKATILPSGSPFLGRDTTICPRDSIVLNAHQGYASYLWQDNSTDSVYKVSTAGTYSVSATDFCGNMSKDSITIKTFSHTAFHLGPALSKCNKDSIIITAPSGFLNYKWSPGTFNNTSKIIVNPDTSIVYTVVAKESTGCMVMDSIKVNVQEVPAISLGRVKSFCEGDSLYPSVGDDFNSYLWNTGDTTRKIIIKSKGIYSVTATTIQGCKSSDTLPIEYVYNHPDVHLDKDTSICFGNSKVLDAGAGYKSYLWNNGSSTQTIVASNISTFWVKVTDNNGCIATDSTKITKINPLPSDFLPPNKGICLDSSFLIKPAKTFSSYLWSTGETSYSILVKKEGTYFLKATDQNNCTGKSYIKIQVRPCNTGFYIPTAFTPNGDGINDIFKPSLFGNITSYHFTIYNRWGQRIFETSELSKGWNGLTNNQDDRTNTYIWTCLYQLDEGPIKHEKGTVMLIR